MTQRAVAPWQSQCDKLRSRAKTPILPLVDHCCRLAAQHFIRWMISMNSMEFKSMVMLFNSRGSLVLSKCQVIMFNKGCEIECSFATIFRVWDWLSTTWPNRVDSYTFWGHAPIHILSCTQQHNPRLFDIKGKRLPLGLTDFKLARLHKQYPKTKFTSSLPVDAQTTLGHLCQLVLVLWGPLSAALALVQVYKCIQAAT